MSLEEDPVLETSQVDYQSSSPMTDEESIESPGAEPSDQDNDPTQVKDEPLLENNTSTTTLPVNSNKISCQARYLADGEVSYSRLFIH